MVVVTGREPLVVTSTFAALAEQEIRAHGAVSDGDDSEELFEQLFDNEAEAFVTIEPLRWQGSSESPRDDALLERCLSAARVPGRPRFVWVTGRDEDDPGLDTIRRAGVPYVIVRVAPLIRFSAEMPWLSGRTVLVPNTLPVPPGGMATPELAAGAIVRAIQEDEWVGRTERVGFEGPQAWSSLVRELGGRTDLVSPWRAQVGRLFGRPVLEADGELVRFRGLEVGLRTRWAGSRTSAG